RCIADRGFGTRAPDEKDSERRDRKASAARARHVRHFYSNARTTATLPPSSRDGGLDTLGGMVPAEGANEELAELTARIAELRGEIDEIKAERERIEHSVEAAGLDPNDALKEKIAAAENALGELDRVRPRRPLSVEASLRQGLTFAGLGLAVSGAL